MTTAILTAADRHRTVAGRFSQVVERVAPSQWSVPTPVREWVALDVLRHLLDWLPGLLAHGASIHLPSGPDPADDPLAAWQQRRQVVQSLLDDPRTIDRQLSNPHVGTLPLADAIDVFYTSDVFLHTWDLARATGQDDTLDPTRCEEMMAGMEPLDEMLRRSGQYGPRVPVSSTAPAQDRLIGFIGRDPNWSPPSLP